MTQGDQQIKAHLQTFGDTSAGQPLPPKAHRHTKTNEPRFDARTPLSRLAGVDLTTIAGIEEGTALVILSEIGTDMHRWPSVKHFWSWLGRCPQHQNLGWEGAVAAGAPRRASRHRRPTPCGPQFAPLEERFGRLFPTSEGTTWDSQSHHGHRPQAGSAGLEPVATRQRFCPTGPRCLRSAVPRAQGHRHGQAGQGPGIDVGAPRGAGIMIAPTAVLILP